MVEQSKDWQRTRDEAAAAKANDERASKEKNLFQEVFEATSKQQERVLSARNPHAKDPDLNDDFSKNPAFHRIKEMLGKESLHPEQYAILKIFESTPADKKYHDLSKKALLESEGKGPKLSNEERADLLSKGKYPADEHYKQLQERNLLSSWGNRTKELSQAEMGELIAHDKYPSNEEAEALYRKSFAGQKLTRQEQEKLDKIDREKLYHEYEAAVHHRIERSESATSDAWNRYLSGEQQQDNRLSWKEYYKNRSLSADIAEKCKSSFGLTSHYYGGSALWEPSSTGRLTAPFQIANRKSLASHFGFKPEYGEYSEAVMNETESKCRAGLNAIEDVNSIERNVAEVKSKAQQILRAMDKKFDEGATQVDVMKVTSSGNTGTSSPTLVGTDLYVAAELIKRKDLEVKVDEYGVIAEKKAYSTASSQTAESEFAQDMLDREKEWVGDIISSKSSSSQIKRAEATLQACGRAFPTMDLHAAFSTMDKNPDSYHPVRARFLLAPADLRDFSANYADQRSQLTQLGINTQTPESAARSCAHVLGEYRNYQKYEGASSWLNTYEALTKNTSQIVVESIWNTNKKKIAELDKAALEQDKNEIEPLALYQLSSNLNNPPLDQREREIARDLQKRLPSTLELVVGKKTFDSSDEIALSREEERLKAELDATEIGGFRHRHREITSANYLMAIAKGSRSQEQQELAEDGNLFINHRGEADLAFFNDITGRKILAQQLANQIEEQLWRQLRGELKQESVDMIADKVIKTTLKDNPQISDSSWAIKIGIENALSKREIGLLAPAYGNAIPSDWYTQPRARAIVKSTAFRNLESAHRAVRKSFKSLGE